MIGNPANKPLASGRVSRYLQASPPRETSMKPACAIACLFAVLGPAEGADKLYTAKPLTDENSFTPGIEGPNCDKDGNIYAVNFAKQQTIGKVSPIGNAEVFV